MDNMRFACRGCLKADEGHCVMVEKFGEKLQLLSAAEEGTTALVAVETEHPQTHSKRVVFVPTQLKGDLPLAKETEDKMFPYNSTVVVPNRPEALDQIGEEFFDAAHDEKELLRELTDFASRRRNSGFPNAPSVKLVFEFGN